MAAGIPGCFRVKAACCTDEFVKVFQPGLRAVAWLLAVVLDQSAALDDVVHLLVQCQSGSVPCQRLDQVQEDLDSFRAPAAAVTGRDHLRRAPQGQGIGLAVLADRIDGACPDTAGGHIDHPLEGRIVVAIGE